VAVGVFHDGQEHYAFHGVTSIENPLPVDDGTLFQFGSTGKTFTSTALLRLVEAGEVDLEAPVRRYVPELRLRDEDAAASVTVLQLLNHTAGWDGDYFEDTGDGDDALARYVERMAELRQITPPGFIAAYNNSSLSLAGRIIEKVTGKVYETAIREMLLDPIGLSMTFFFMNDVMTRRFVVGHRVDPEGAVTVMRPWAMARSGNPMGGMAATASDQIRWARFHLDHGRTLDGVQLVGSALIDRMQEPTVHAPGSNLGDAVGISWLLGEVGGERVVRHGGATIGQLSAFQMIPDRGYAFVALTNAEPNGLRFNAKLSAWALATYLGLEATDPVTESRPADALAPFAGVYGTFATTLTVTVEDDHLSLTAKPTPELIAQLGDDSGYDEPPVPLHMLAGYEERWTVLSGEYTGAKGYFLRDDDGRVTGIHVSSRYVPRTGD
jgi:CubicO group peptidase (beta-lactamase class C family)